MSDDKAKKRILVTGASKGIGRAIAVRVAREGYPVTVHFGGDAAGAETTAATILEAGGQAEIIGFDVTDRTSTFEFNPGNALLTISEAAGGELYAGYADGTVYHILTPSG